MTWLLRIDSAQLAAADAAVAWLWTALGVPRRMLLRMALAGMLLTEALAEVVVEGRVELATLLIGGLAMALYHLNDMRWGGDPKLQRAMVQAVRRRPFAIFVRLAIWPWTAWTVFTSLSSPALPLELASQALFLVFMIGGHALPPDGPRKGRRREPRRPRAGAAAPVRAG